MTQVAKSDSTIKNINRLTKMNEDGGKFISRNDGDLGLIWSLPGTC